MTPSPTSLNCVLFDLDGTLADTAPDLAGALNELRAEHGLDPLPLDGLRPAVNGGAARIVEAGLPRGGDDLIERYLALYEARVCRDTRLFPGIADLLNALDARDITWGIVTNKKQFLTMPILEALGLDSRAACIVCGDTVADSKPHPAPVIHALKQLDTDPADAWYLGDAERDIVAAHGARTRAAVALWGYLAEGDDPGNWGAEALVESPQAVLGLLYPDAGRDAAEGT